MIENIKKSFQIIIKNSALIQPLIMFILFLLVFNAFMGMNVHANPAMSFVFLILTVLLLSAFLSGWLYMIKFAIDNYKGFDKNDPEYALKIGTYNINTLKKFFMGVGEYFFPMILVVILSIFISNFLIYFGMYFLKIKSMDFLINVAQSSQNFPQISLRQIAFLLYIALVTFVFHFITLFWLPEILYKTKNSIVAFFKSIGFLFRHFLTSIILYLFLVFCFFAMQILSILLMFNQILVLIAFILFLYLITYSLVLIFMTYKAKFMKDTVEQMNKKDIFIKSGDEVNEE